MARQAEELQGARTFLSAEECSGRRRGRFRTSDLLAWASATCLFLSQAQAAPPGADLFTNGPVLHLRIEIAQKDAVELRHDSRKYVPAVLREGGKAYQVRMHLKGSTGSFRQLDEKPSFTMNFKKASTKERFHGLEKIHLNNSIEDPSYMNELLGSELFRSAGVPAPRVAHAVVELNGRPLGLYVLKEGFTEDFLGLYFRQTKGNLYEPGEGHDVDEPLTRTSGKGPEDLADLKALAAAAREPDLQRRWQRLRQLLDMERFVSFMVMEIMACHRDGYCLARNNFRIYHDPDTDRIVFLPQGMDQLFGKSNAPVQPLMNGVMARAILETLEGQERYRQRFTFLLTNRFDASALAARVDAILPNLRAAVSSGEARSLEREVTEVKGRIARRRLELERELKEPPLEPLRFERDIATLTIWRETDPPDNGSMDHTTWADGRKALHIRAGAMTAASWRSPVLLFKGRYRFEGAVRTKSVEPLSFGKNQGASLRALGVSEGAGHLTGEQEWKELRLEFEVKALRQEIELLCELRARGGEAWFALDSLRLVRLE